MFTRVGRAVMMLGVSDLLISPELSGSWIISSATPCDSTDHLSSNFEATRSEQIFLTPNEEIIFSTSSVSLCCVPTFSSAFLGVYDPYQHLCKCDTFASVPTPVDRH
jgi:hypothetical protein